MQDITPTTKPKTEKVDLAIRSIDNQFDLFTGEDKPMSATTKTIDDTVEKNKDRRVTTLQVIEEKLPHRQVIDNFEALTALWHGEKLVIHGTRKVGGHFFHYQAASVSFPLAATSFHEFARLLMVVISLKIGKTSSWQ